jgi:hypothetical protein
LFMFVSVRPLLDAYEARRGAQLLAHHGIKLNLHSVRDDFYTRIEFDPRPPRSFASERGEIPFWLRPLSGDLASLPLDESVVSIDVSTNDQVVALAETAPRLKNLESLEIWGRLSPSAMDLLQNTVPDFERLVEISIKVPTTDVWLASLTNVRSLFIWGEGPGQGLPLSSEQIRAVAKLPNLEVLMIFGDGVNDATVQPSAQSASLRRLILRKTDVTSAGVKALSNKMPNCEIRR